MKNCEKYDQLNKILVKSALENNVEQEAEKIKQCGNKDEIKLVDIIIHPQETSPIVQIQECSCPTDEKAACEISCLFDAIKRDASGKLVISDDCKGCERCLDACKNNSIVGQKNIVPLIEQLRKKETPFYAMIAPAFSGQFSPEVTSGKLRSAFKALGFYGMIEVALFADILTLKEALEFDRFVKEKDDFLLTSCCCPMWVALIRKKYNTLTTHVPPSVSPMVACGRSIKKIVPEAKTVFIGPCLAKKAEAREPDIADAVDYVLTFDEVFDMFNAAGLNLAKLPEDIRDHSSRAGRIYARTSGVSEAVKSTIERLYPNRKVPLIAQQADGIIECKELLKKISEGNIQANFIEGMGCKGGCVGGPKSLIDKDKATEHVNRYADSATYDTPVDNVHVIEILHRLGFDTIESLLDRDNTFTREF